MKKPKITGWTVWIIDDYRWKKLTTHHSDFHTSGWAKSCAKKNIDNAMRYSDFPRKYYRLLPEGKEPK